MDEHSGDEHTRRLIADIRSRVTRPWTLMCVCGGQTHVAVQHDIDRMLPEPLKLVYGPGCAVCVTPTHILNRAIEFVSRPETILCTSGELLRVPASNSTLLEAKAAGADVRAVYSPLDAVSIACEHPESEVVYLAVGFESAAPAAAVALYRAQEANLRNFSILGAYLRMAQALEVVLSAKEPEISGILAGGHASTVAGYVEYEPIARRHTAPIVLAGLDPYDILDAAYRCVKQLEEGRAEVECTHSCSAPRTGDPSTQFLVDSVFLPTDTVWRGFGEVPQGGLRLRSRFAAFDATLRHGIPDLDTPDPSGCMSAAILRGECTPNDCPSFDHHCRPEHPVGPSMVSSRGICAAHFRHRRSDDKTS